MVDPSVPQSSPEATLDAKLRFLQSLPWAKHVTPDLMQQLARDALALEFSRGAGALGLAAGRTRMH